MAPCAITAWLTFVVAFFHPSGHGGNMTVGCYPSDRQGPSCAMRARAMRAAGRTGLGGGWRAASKGQET
eukprot:scaffold262236_cov31-Tisochrysis_lutea.AAC.2